MYCIYSSNKTDIINNCFSSNFIRFRSILLAGEKGTGKKITGFHIVKKFFENKSIFNIFYNTNFLYLLKDPPIQELKIILNLIKDTSDFDLKRKYIKKILFLYLRVCSQLIYNISEYKKSVPEKIIESLTYFYYKLKNYDFNTLYSDNVSYSGSTLYSSNIDVNDNKTNNYISDIEKYVLDISDDILFVIDNFKSDYIYINEIHKIQHWIGLSAKKGKKIILIENIEKMSVDSANAFLKTLEEPPADLLFILTTNNKYKILPTIRSRCALYNIDSIGTQEFKNILIEEWGKKYIELFETFPKSFTRFLELLEEDKNRIDYVKNANNFLKLLFLNEDDFFEVYSILINIKNINGFEKFIDEILYVLRNPDSYKILVYNKSYTKDQIKNIERFLDFLLWANKNLNYSLENGLVYLYLNRDRIFSGDFDGEKFFL